MVKSTDIQCLFSVSTANCKKNGLKHKLCLTGLAQHPSPSPKYFIVVSNRDTIQADQTSPIPSVSHSLHAPGMYMYAGRSITDPSSQFVLMDPFPTSSVKLLL